MIEEQLFDGFCPRCASDKLVSVKRTPEGVRKYRLRRCGECGLSFELHLRRVLVAEFEHEVRN